VSQEPGLKRRRLPKGLTLRAMVPNAITAAALCAGLTGIRFAIAGDFEKSVMAVILAGLLDGIDGRAARMLKAQSKFGEELDSLADSISFGVAPALIVYLWTLQELPSIGWIASLAFAISCVMRLARYNSQIELDDLPIKEAGFLTGIPAPVGAGLAFLPLYFWIETGRSEFTNPIAITAWMLLVAFLMISRTPTLSWSKLRPPRSIRIELIALAGLIVTALLTEPWMTLIVISLGYLALIPVALHAYLRFKRRREAREMPSSGERTPDE